MKLNVAGRVIINGVEYAGGSINIVNGKVIRDGQEEGSVTGPISVVVHGEVKSLSVGSGDVTAGVVGSIQTGSGDVRCESAGSVQTASGDVTAGKILGSASSMSGNVTVTAQ